MCLAQAGVELERPDTGLASLGKGFCWTQCRVEAQDGIRIGDAGMGRGVAQVPRQCLLEIVETSPQIRLAAAIPEMTAFEIEGVGLQIVRGGLTRAER